MKLTAYDSTPFLIWRKFPIGNLKFPICFKVGIDFSRLDENSWKKNLTYWVWRRLPWLVIRWSNVTLRRKFLVHSLEFEDFKKIRSCFHFFQTDFLFWKIYSLAENQTIVRTMTGIPNFCPKTKRLFLPFYFSIVEKFTKIDQTFWVKTTYFCCNHYQMIFIDTLSYFSLVYNERGLMFLDNVLRFQSF